MNFQDLLTKIKQLDEEVAGQDLGNGFQKVTVNLGGRQVPAVLDTQSNTTITLNKDPATGGAIFRSMAPYVTMVDGKVSTTMTLGPATAAAMQKAGIIQSVPVNETDLDEAAPVVDPTQQTGNRTPAKPGRFGNPQDWPQAIANKIKGPSDVEKDQKTIDDMYKRRDAQRATRDGVDLNQPEPAYNECGDEPSKMPNDGEFLTGECGGMMSSPAPKQSDSVTMNVSMNGSGAGGIRDLIGILRNIEQSGSHKDADDVLVGIGAEEAFDNEPNPTVAGINAVTPTGDDLHSKGGIGRRGVHISGSNAMESLISKLSAKYESIKGN